MNAKRNFLRGVAVALASTLPVTAALAQAWPTKPITIYVAFAPGGAGDIVARLVGKEMSKNLGQPIIVENRPVPGVAVSAVKNAKPDGYTLMVAGNGTALSQSLFKVLPYDVNKDFVHVSTMAFFDLALLADRDSPFNTAADVLSYAKANPGKLTIGTVRLGSTQNLSAEMFKSMTGIDAVIVPYKTTSEILTGLRSKDIQIAFEIVPPILPQIGAKTVKTLAVTSTRRFPGLPQVPTLGETVRGYEVTSWNGISAPLGTPPAIVERLSKEVNKAVASPEVQRRLQEVGMVARAGTPAEMAQRMRDDVAKWGALIDKAGIERQ